ncbi:ribonuclease E inhibitor RraB [Novosphingobium kaempferiae]|uniref:ribonuclease E inhibitor RraB n=1 Tax=Novosphingobium kaempferiae TaxID=2896849 RepID=UPI001E55974B|nr:ribonuclease E inhibitor RraB [Novosphingobium kaempferiae]
MQADDDRPSNREVENEMICPPPHEGVPPRPATEPARADLDRDWDREPGAGETAKNCGLQHGLHAPEEKTVIFSFVFLNRASAQAFAVAIENKHVRAEIVEAKDGAAPCTVRVATRLIAHARRIAAMQKDLQRAAELREGRANGWHCLETDHKEA